MLFGKHCMMCAGPYTGGGSEPGGGGGNDGGNWAGPANGAIMMNDASATFFGPGGYNSGAGSCSDNWPRMGMLCTGSGGDGGDLTVRPTKNGTVGSTWSAPGNGVNDWVYAVVDLSQARTFQFASYGQMFSDGKTTHVKLDYMTTAPSGYVDAGWTPVHGEFALTNTSEQEWTNFTEVTARYVRVACRNNGSFGDSSWIELFSFKLTNGTGG
jgi:hypothetical protein